MRPSLEEQKKLNEIHAKNPQLGDYWEERLVGVCVVLEVTDQKVVLCLAKQNIDDWSWTWDFGLIQTKDREKFAQWLAYGGSVQGYWADVRPKAHEWAVKEYLLREGQGLYEEPTQCP